MRNLPVAVGEDDIEDMFNTADADGDGQIGYKVDNRYIKCQNRYILQIQEFQNMINPPKPPEGPKPTKAQFKSLYTDIPHHIEAPVSVLSPPALESENDSVKATLGMSITSFEDQLSTSSNIHETDVRYHSGMKNVNSIANL